MCFILSLYCSLWLEVGSFKKKVMQHLNQNLMTLSGSLVLFQQYLIKPNRHSPDGADKMRLEC